VEAQTAAVDLSKSNWQLTSITGNAHDIRYNGKTVISSVGALRMEEIPQVSTFEKACMLLGKGTWHGEPYAMWEGRMDDGRYYIAHVNQVTHVGNSLTWTAHVQWLPPLYHVRPHMNAAMRIPAAAFVTLTSAAGPVALADIPEGGQTIPLAKTNTWQQHALVLKGPAGAFRAVLTGIEGNVHITKDAEGYTLALREKTQTPGPAPQSNRNKWYAMTDIRVKRMTIEITPLDQPPSPRSLSDYMFPKVPRARKIPVSADLPCIARGVATINYSHLRGARSKDENTWNVGWWPKTFKLDDYKHLDGIWYQDFTGQTHQERTVATSKGRRTIETAKLLPSRADGLEVPHLGILGDIVAAHVADGLYPVRYFADDGSTAKEHRLTDVSVTGTPNVWFLTKPSLKSRTGRWPWPRATRFGPRYAYLDSPRLDTNADGKWNPSSGTVMSFNTYRLTTRMAYAVFIPPTWFDVPAKRGGQVVFRYLAKDGEKNARIALHPDYTPRRGVIRIGFLGRAGYIYYKRFTPGIYIVQTANGKGRIIGKIADSKFDDHLAIVPGSLKVSLGGKWKPTDRIPQDKRRWFASQEYIGACHRNSNWPDFASEHAYWEEAFIADWGYLKLHSYGGARSCGTTYRDPFMDLYARPVRMFPRPQWFTAGQRYGIRRVGMYHPSPSRLLCPSEYMAELIDPRHGTFYKINRFDKTNPKAMDWIAEEYRKLLLPYRGSGIAFVTSGEMGGRAYMGYAEKANALWSHAALHSYRKYIGNPSAKLPTDTFVDPTDRTTNKVTPDEFELYVKWVKRMFINRNLAMYKGSGQALGLGKDPWYIGARFLPVALPSVYLRM